MNGVSGTPFFQEFQQITNGTGVLDINLGSPLILNNAGVFTFTGGTLIASTPTSVPEPNIAGVLLVMGTGLLLERNLHSLKKCKTN